jgi:Na+-translocating ferredoxin:NAD+ oxidoreductase RNF subunit RnfB
MTASRVSRRDFLSGRSRLALSQQPSSLGTVAATESTGRQLAQIDHARCLAAASQICTVCLERCGARGAIQLRGLYPKVLADRCTGCGDCVRDCPAPMIAIRLRPREEPRP